ncbi:MAG: DUF6940 family protein [Gammaproteobacteria bacterium]
MLSWRSMNPGAREQGPMWQVASHEHDNGTILAQLLREGEPLTYADVIDQLCRSDEFCRWFARQLADAPYASFFWETPPVTSRLVKRAFEYALVDAPMLAVQAPDTRSFAEYFHKSEQTGTVAVIPNLGGDAVMVVPEIIGPASAYTDFASFLRSGPDAQKLDLLRALAVTIHEQLGQRPLWVSTSGLGVAWLHVRLDTYPKYYQHGPYRIYGEE